MMPFNIPVVVAAYNRPSSLLRLLKSLNNAEYPSKTRLIISIDHGGTKKVFKTANEFEWQHGEKEIIEHNNHLGLKAHILSCGDISLSHDGVIVLEDDLYVSPDFYKYTLEAFAFYGNDSKIAGISLYSHNYNETAGLPFIPLNDDSDVFFMQVPSSWGQCWSKKQWMMFQEWRAKNCYPIKDKIPSNVIAWPESSWKKTHFGYLLETNSYFVYPRMSLTTNFAEAGTHFKRKEHHLQTPLSFHANKFRFKNLAKSFIKYDGFCEISPDSLKQLQPILRDYRFTVDIYGMKEASHINTSCVLTTKKCKSPLLSFSLDLKPVELNVIGNIQGSDLHLSSTSDCDLQINQSFLFEKKFHYFYNLRDFQLRHKIKTDDEFLRMSLSLDNTNKKLVKKDAQIKYLKELLCNIERSYTFRLGKLILWPFTTLRRIKGFKKLS